MENRRERAGIVGIPVKAVSIYVRLLNWTGMKIIFASLEAGFVLGAGNPMKQCRASIQKLELPLGFKSI